MKKYQEGLVIGKFYPPHIGHRLLINQAAEQSEHLTVLVMGTSYDTVNSEARAEMIETVHAGQNITVVPVIDDVYDDYDSASIWKAHNVIIENSVNANIDAVFSSEEYGTELAEYFNAEHVCVDLDRKRHPISATLVRKDVFKQWGYLDPAVRDHFRFKVVVMGAESTGTTTLSKALKNHYRGRGGIFSTTPYVPEYGREYTEKLIEKNGTRDIVWTPEDFRNIQEGQSRLYEDALKLTKSPLIISDTDELATEAFTSYFGISDDYGVGMAKGMNPDNFYLITDHTNVPLVDDGSRLQNVANRDKSTQYFIDVCKKYGVSYALVTGDRKERLDISVKMIDRLMGYHVFMRSPK